MQETRYTQEFRAAGAEEYKIFGYAARYGTIAMLGDFDETIEEGAFDRCIKEQQDVRCLFNHDENTVLGRTKNGTLKLNADKRGLYFECQLNPQSEQHRNLYQSVQRGDISECSFSFNVPKAPNAQVFEVAGRAKPLRRVKDLNLFDVSPVTYPAYPTGTSVTARKNYFDVEARSALAASLGKESIIEPEDVLLVNLDDVRDMVMRWRCEELAKII